MAVSTADFYTYARETGTPVPKSREEQAALYPAVNQWKRSRLSIPRTESKEQYLERNDLGGLETAATIGGIIGAGLLGRRYLKNVDARVKDAPTATKAPTQSVEEVINKTANLGNEAKYVRTPVYTKDDYGKTVPTDSRGISTVDLDTLYKEPIDPQVEKAKEIYIVDDPVLQRRIRGEEPKSLPPGRSTALEYMAQSNMIDPETAYVSDIAAENPLAILKSRGDEQIDVIQGTVANPKLYPQTTSEVHRQIALARKNRLEKLEVAAEKVRQDILSDQSINAIGAAEDQDTGRVIQQLQRNPEIDQTKAALLEEMFEEQDRKFAQGLESGEIAPGREYVAPIDKVAGTLPDGAVVVQAEKRVGIAKEQDFVQQALDKVKPEVVVTELPEALSRQELNALEGIDWELKQTRSQDQPKFYENRNIDTNRIANAPKIKTGTVLDNLVGNLPAVAIAADEVARRGVKDIGDTVKGIRRVVVENAPSNLPDFSRVDTAPTVQTTDGSAIGPFYPVKQFVRGLTGDESVDIIDTSGIQDELLDTARVKKNVEIRDQGIKEQLQNKRALLEAQGLRGTRLERQLQSDPEVQGLLKELSTPPKVVLPGQISSALPPEEIAGVQSVQNVRDLDYRQADFYDPDDVVIDQTAQGRALRGGKITGGEMKYQDAGGQWVTDDITKRPTESIAPVKFTDYSYIDDQNKKRTITAREKGLNYQALQQGDPEAVKRARQAVEISEAQRIASDPRRVEQRTGRPARPQYMVEEQRRATKNQDPSIPLGGAMVTLRDELQQLGPQEQRPVLRQGADGVEYYDLPDPKTGKDYTKNTVGAVETSSAFTGPARYAAGPVKGSQSLPEVTGDSSLYRQREIQPTQQSDSVLKIVDYANNPSGQLQQINTAKIGPIGLPEQNVGSLPKGIELPGRPREAAMDQAQDFVADALARTTVTDAPVVYPYSDITERLAATQSPSLPPGYNISRSTGQLIQNPQISRGVVERPQSYAGLSPKFSHQDVNTYQIGKIGQSTSTRLSPFIGPMGERVATPVYPGVSNPPQRLSSLAYVPRREGSILGRTAQSPLPGQSVDNPARWLQTPTAGGARIAYPNITDDKRLSASFPRAGADATMLRTRRFKSDQDLKRYLNRGN